MSLLARVTDFLPNTIIQSQPFDDEFNQLVNLLSGISQNKSIKVINNDAAFATARFDHRALTGNIVEIYADGVEAARFEKSGKLVTTHTGINTNFNADKLDDKHLSDIIVTLSKTWLYPVLPGGVESIESQPRFIVPTIGVNKITKIYSVWADGSDSSASNIFTIKRRNAAGALQSDVGTIDVNSGAQNVINSNDIGDVTLTAGDQIYPLFTTRNTASEQMVSISIEITVQPT